ncbi:hypothetical protein LCGC14_2316260, partial [marine sediment metagenome]
MKVCYQPTLARPKDRVEIDSADWHLTPKRSVPVGGEVIDQQPGHIHEVCIQGMSSTGDHHVVKDLPNGECLLTSWTNDPDDDPGHPSARPTDPLEHWFHAQEIHFRPLAPDSKLGGAINTNISRVIYGGKGFLGDWNKRIGPVKNTILKPWSDFILPPENITRHGIWVPDKLEELHKEVRSLADWRAWGQHLDPKELDDDGLLKIQFPQGRFAPKRGTITYFQRDTDQASGVHGVTAANENQLAATAGASETENSPTLTASSDVLAFLFTTLASNPNDADWPNGLYECQLDVRMVAVATLVNPSGTTEVRSALPETITEVVRGNRYYIEVWASDV